MIHIKSSLTPHYLMQKVINASTTFRCNQTNFYRQKIKLLFSVQLTFSPHITKSQFFNKLKYLFTLFLGMNEEHVDWKFYLVSLPVSRQLLGFSFAPFIKNKEIVTYIGDILSQFDSKTQISGGLRNFHETLRKAKLRANPGKKCFLSAAINFFGHVMTRNKVR